MRRFYDPMMCPQRYHAWSEKFREHGFEGAGDYWWDWSGREYSLISALEVTVLRESYDRMGEQVRAIGTQFARMAEEMKPAIADFVKAVSTPALRQLACIEDERTPLTDPDQVPDNMTEEEAREFFDDHEVTEEYIEKAGGDLPEDLPIFRPREG